MDEAEKGMATVYLVLQKMKDDLSRFFWDAFTALGVNGISGDYVEFGSDGATSIRLAYDVISGMATPRHLWAFDSFAGLPATGDVRDEHPAFSPSYNQGGSERFHQMCADHGMAPDRYTAVEGYFEDTLGQMVSDAAPVDIALAYVDCNLYSSTVTTLEFLAPRLKHGMIVAFDDYFCWSPTDASGERRALAEFETRHPEWHFERFKDPTWGAVSYVVERADLMS